MNDILDMKHRWEALHTEPRFRPRYPHEEVVRWAFRSFNRRAERPPRVLDVGCGGGRHAVFLAREGFDVSACDISQTGVDETQAAARALAVTLDTQCCAANELQSYPDGHFDGALCYGVYCYMTVDEIAQSIQHVHRTLKSGGGFMCMTRNDGDARMRGATPAGEHRYRLAQLDDSAPSDAEVGMPMTFLPAAAVDTLFADFETVEVIRMTLSRMDGRFVDDDWLIYAQK